MKHLNGSGLVADARNEEATELLPALILRSRALGGIQTLGAALRSDSRGQIGELLSLQRHQLVTGLRRL
jgi:hypothetical protein